MLSTRRVSPRVEKLIAQYLRGYSLGEAWRRAGYGGKREYHRTYTYQMIYANKRNRAHLEELRTKMAKRHEITIDKVLTDYAEAMEIAKAKGDAANIVSAATAQAKLVGLLRDRQEIGRPGDFDNADSLSDILARVAEQAGPEAALAVSKAIEIIDAQNEKPSGELN